MKTIIYLALLACATTTVLAAPGSVSTSRAQPAQKSPAQIAQHNYKSGAKTLAKVHKYDQKLAAEKTDKARSKLEKKINKTLMAAEKKFKVAVKNDPSLFEAHSELGYTLYRLGKFDAALVAFDNALGLKPAHTKAMESRGETCLSMGRLEEAKKTYISLYDSDRAMADKLLRAMEHWIENPTTRPASVNDDQAKEFSGWVSEQKAIAEQTASL